MSEREDPKQGSNASRRRLHEESNPNLIEKKTFSFNRTFFAYDLIEVFILFNHSIKYEEEEEEEDRQNSPN